MTTETPNNLETSDETADASKTDRLRETAYAARERAGAAYDTARERANAAYDTARESAARASRRTAEGIESNPVAAVVGGLAIGALIAAVLPKTEGETQAFGKIGKKLADSAKDAAASARETGKAKLSELGLDQAKEKLGALVGQGSTKA